MTTKTDYFAGLEINITEAAAKEFFSPEDLGRFERETRLINGSCRVGYVLGRIGDKIAWVDEVSADPKTGQFKIQLDTPEDFVIGLQAVGQYLSLPQRVWVPADTMKNSLYDPAEEDIECQS